MTLFNPDPYQMRPVIHWLSAFLTRLFFLFLDLLGGDFSFFPFMTYGLTYFLILYKPGFSSLIDCFIFALLLEMAHDLPMGTLSLNYLSLAVFALMVRTYLKKISFFHAWLGYGVSLMGILLQTTLVAYFFFGQSFDAFYSVKYCISWTFFPLMYLLLIHLRVAHGPSKR